MLVDRTIYRDRSVYREHRDRLGTGGGLLVVAILLPLYPVIAEEAAHPLTLFVLAPLVTCALSGWKQTALVAVLGVVGALAAEQLADPSLAGTALTARMAVVVIGGILGVAVAYVRNRRDHDLAEAAATIALSSTLQSGLLPEPPETHGFEVAVRYCAGERRMLVGGDFVDLVVVDEDRLAFIVGDVCGHGPAAAALGAALRAGWRALVHSAPVDPLAWVHRLDDVYLQPIGSASGHVTACTGLVDRSRGSATIVSAGHPWPVRLGSEPALVEVHAGQPMGLVPEAPSTWAARQVPLQPGESLLIYTDGLIEARVSPGAAQRRGHEALLASVPRDRSAPLESLLDHLLEMMSTGGSGGTGSFEDDVALLIVRPVRHAGDDPDDERSTAATGS
jgi:serine phosphatase RsbU (regulator of sigma subunit)